MSGGSMDYLYGRLQHGATFDEETPERKALREVVDLMATALHDVEWVDSGDYGEGAENAAIRALLARAAELHAELKEAS